MRQQRKGHKKGENYNLFGQMLTWLYSELGIQSDMEVAEKSKELAREGIVPKALHQTTISTDRRTRRASRQTIRILIQVFQSYPKWKTHVLSQEPNIEHDLFVAADRADPREQNIIQNWLKSRKGARTTRGK